MRVALLTIAVLLAALPAQARTISYPGGVTFMTMNDADSNAAQVFYTFNPSFSAGVNHEYMRDAGAQLSTVQLNYLAKRWNLPDAQANIFLNAAAGAARDAGEYKPAAYAGVEADWENRRLFTQYKNRFLWADDTEKFVKHTARVGVAPYVGDYGDLHTWLMLQADYDAGKDDNFSVTPLVRLFKGTALVEAGYNLDGGVLFNVMYNF